MFNLMAAIAKALGKQEEIKDRANPIHFRSSHAGGHERPEDFEHKRKVRRKMAKMSRRINRRML